jgi:hypothetical protein
MSNLTYSTTTGKFSTVFDVLRGWPNGGAVEESYAVTSGATVAEGTFVVLGTAGTVAVPSSVVTAAITLRLVIQGSDQSDAKFVGKVVTLRGPVTIKSEKFLTGATAITKGALLAVSKETGSQGYLINQATTGYTTAAVIGVCEDITADYVVAALNF